MAKKLYRTRWIWVMRVIAVSAAIFTIVAFVRQQQKLGRMVVEKQQVDEQLSHVVRVNQELEKRVEYMNSDQYIKDAARVKLGMIRDGEIIYYETPHTTAGPVDVEE